MLGTPIATTIGCIAIKLVPTLDQTLATLLDDLEQRGLLESTVVLAIGEFWPHTASQPERRP